MMYPALSLFCLPLLAASPAPATASSQGQALPAQQSSRQARAIIDPLSPVFETNEHDFGAVFSDWQYSHKFRFKSGRGLSIKVTKVEAGCKCSAGVIREPAAGSDEWGEIEVKVKMGKRSGSTTQHVKVKMMVAAEKKKSQIGQSAPRGKPLVVPLTLKAYVVQRGVHLKPARLMFGRIARDASPKKTVRVEIVTALVPREIKKVCSSKPWIQVSIKEVPVEKDKRQAIAEVCAYDLTLKLDAAKAKPGSFLEFVTVYSNSTRYPFADLPLKGRVER